MDMEDKQVKFKYVFEKNYNPVYCNGAYGGVNVQGEIVANFYLERLPVPNHVIHEITDEGTLSGVVSSDPEDLNKCMVRYITNGIILNEDSARAIYEWLGEQIQEIETRKATK